MKRRNPWLVVGGGVLGLVIVLIAGVAAYWRYANQLPTYPTPNIVMPVPNAYDDYVAAGQMCKAAGGATLPAAPPPPPVRQAPARAARSNGAPASPPGYGSGPGSGYPGPGGYPGGPPAAPASPSGRPLQAYDPGAPLAQVREVVRRNRPALARLRQGFGSEYRCPPYVSFSQPFPELAEFRELARVLVTEGKLAEREGRYRDATHSYLDCLRLGVDAPRGGVLIHGLVAVAIQSIGLRPLQELAPRLDVPTAAAAARAMARLDARSVSLSEILANEKEGTTTSLLETLSQSNGWQQLTGMASGGGSGPPTGEEMLMALQFAFYPKRLMLDHYRGYMDRTIANVRKPYYAQPPAPPLPGDPLSRIVLPIFDNARFVWAKRDAQWRLTELLLATRAYEEAHGKLLPSLDALVPAYLPAVPEDPFAPKPMVYRRKAGGARVYSRGPDGKDDAGKDLGADAQREMKGDIASLKSSRRR